MAEYTTENYKNIYDKLKPEIEKACNCISSNPSSQVLELFTASKSAIQSSLQNLSWNDEIKASFDEGINCILGNLDTLANSISIWADGENRYIAIQEKLEDLNKIIIEFDELISEKPNKDDSKYYDTVTKEVDGIKKTESEYNGSKYQSDLEDWENKCETYKSKCDEVVEEINNEIKALEAINNNTVTVATASLISRISNLDIDSLIQLGYATSKDDIKGLDSYYWTADGKLIIRYNQKNGMYAKTYNGVNLSSAGCGVMALAAALTTTLTEANGGKGHEVYVTPFNVLDALKNYNGGSVSKYFTNDGMSANYDELGKTLSTIYGVNVVSTNSGSLSKDAVINATDKTDATVVYSYANRGHIGSVEDSDKNGTTYQSDTTSGGRNLVDGTKNYSGAKRWLTISASTYQKEPDGTISVDGQTKFTKETTPFGTGNITYSDSGVNYQLTEVTNPDGTLSYKVV